MSERVRVVLRGLALRDVEDAVDWCRDEVDTDTALRFVARLEATLDNVARHPGSGSPRWASELDLPGCPRPWFSHR
jgi:toxin ParE1/3/4